VSRPRGPSLWLHRLGIRRLPATESVAWEIDHHLQEAVDRLVAEGWTPEQARAEAERRFGDRARYGPRMARMERRGVVILHLTEILTFLSQSIGAALRTARRYPGFTLGVVLTLGLGIGANATMYGIIDRLLLSPPEHVAQPEHVRRVALERPNPLTGRVGRQTALSYPDYEDFQAQEGITVAAYDRRPVYTIGRGEEVTQVSATTVSAGFLPMLGVQPRLGRLFTEEETAVGAPLTAILSEEYWTRAFGADPDVLGRTIDLADDAITIIGVLPRGFTGVDLESVDLWLPLEPVQAREEGGITCMQGRNCWWVGAIARLDEGVSVERAQEEATALHLNGRRDLIEAGRYPDVARIVMSPLVAAAGPDASSESRVARWLMGVALIVFLIACANVANLQLARGTERSRETAVRLALGVGRARLVTQMTLEAVALALAGGAVALAIARWGGALIRNVLLPEVYFPDAGLSGRLLAFVAVSSVLAGLLAGLWPAVQASRLNLAAQFGDPPGRSARLRGALTVAQAGMSVVLLVGAGLFIKSLDALRAEDLGIDVDRIMTVDLEFPRPDVGPQQRQAAYDEAARRISSLPSVEAVAETAVPLGYTIAIEMRVPGLDSLPRLPGGGPYVFSVGPGYFETAGVSLLSGRAFEAGDDAGAAKVALVPEGSARALWPDADPLGQCLMVGQNATECTTVVGVVQDAARNGYLDDQYLAYYIPMGQAPPRGEGFLAAPNGLYVRVRGDMREAREAVLGALRGYSPDVRWIRAWPLSDTLDQQARSWTLGATMFTAFGVLALVLAAVGLYGVLAFDVARRTRELGVRTALGARRSLLLASVIRRGLAMGALGIALGLGVAYFAGPYVQDLLYEVSPRDPWVLGAVASTLLAVGAASAVVPGLRATRVDPMTALKSD